MNDDIAQIDLSIKQAKNAIDLKESVIKLSKNRDFKKVIDEGYFEKEASRLVLLRADPSLQNDKDQEMILKSIDAIAYFRQYLGTTIQLGNMAEKSIKDAKEAKEELAFEED